MSGESFRFIHASDFHLETPLGDLDQLPPNLRDAMATAPRDAATAVLEAALATNIDFLVLSGDLLHPVAAGPHGMSLLLDYFEKLHAAKKPVYWAAGIADVVSGGTPYRSGRAGNSALSAGSGPGGPTILPPESVLSMGRCSSPNLPCWPAIPAGHGRG